MELAASEREMKVTLERDVALDHAAILDWRRGQAARGTDGIA
jgi:hypothetical protein